MHFPQTPLPPQLDAKGIPFLIHKSKRVPSPIRD
jgi:hypothetical protein